MGGNALKEFGTRRASLSEAMSAAGVFTAAVDSIFQEHGFSIPSHLIQAYHEKNDFGDLDIVVLQEAVESIGIKRLHELLEQKIGHAMPFRQDHPNATHVSMGYPLGDGSLLQVDLLFAKAAEFDFTCKYLAWNDLGNLMTVMAKKMGGLKFGMSGLTIKVKFNGHALGDVVFTRDFYEAISFIGYKPERYARGFDTLLDIYQFAADHPRFNTSMYLLENRNHKSRMRDKKRSTYNGFLEWMQIAPVSEHEWDDDSRDTWLEKAFERFPEARFDYDLLIAEETKRIEVKKIFSGKFITGLTGLRHESLGIFMDAFKKYYGEKEFLDHILSRRSDHLEDDVKVFYEHWKKFPAVILEEPEINVFR